MDKENTLQVGAAYIRVSTEEQTELSPDSQLRLIQEYAKSHNIIVPEKYTFIDDGISGRETKRRDAFNRMIGTAKLKPKPFNVILLWKFSRFARNREDSIVYKSMLRKQLGIDVISISEPTGDEKMSVLIEALIEAMDEYYSVNLSEEVKRGMTEKAMRGGLQSSPSYGYRAEKNTLVIETKEAEIVKEIFRRFCQGGGYLEICKWCNNMGCKTHRGNQFENRTIEYIIRNPVYIGKLRWNPAGRSRRAFDDPNIIVQDGQHEPIIDMETWETAQKRVAEVKARWRPHQRPASEYRDWISGLIKCGDCGATMIRTSYGGYQCSGYSKGKGCYSHWVSGDLLKDAIIERIRRDSDISDGLEYRVTRIAQTKKPETDAIERKLSRLQNSLDRLREAYLDGAETLSDYKATKKKLDSAITEAKAEILRCSNSEPNQTANADQLQKALKAVLSVLTDSQSTDQEKHDAVHKCIDRCIWDKQENRLTVKYVLLLP